MQVPSLPTYRRCVAVIVREKAWASLFYVSAFTFQSELDLRDLFKGSVKAAGMRISSQTAA